MATTNVSPPTSHKTSAMSSEDSSRYLHQSDQAVTRSFNSLALSSEWTKRSWTRWTSPIQSSWRQLSFQRTYTIWRRDYQSQITNLWSWKRSINITSYRRLVDIRIQKPILLILRWMKFLRRNMNRGRTVRNHMEIGRIFRVLITREKNGIVLGHMVHLRNALIMIESSHMTDEFPAMPSNTANVETESANTAIDKTEHPNSVVKTSTRKWS